MVEMLRSITAPTSHHLTIIEEHGKQIHGRVVYLRHKGAGVLSFGWGALDE